MIGMKRKTEDISNIICERRDYKMAANTFPYPGETKSERL